MIDTIYKIGVTGHRDLKKACVKHYENKVSELLQKLQNDHNEVIVYSPLADGADRLVVKEAFKLDIPYIVILPMPKRSYVMDFDVESTKEFNSLLQNSNEVITIAACQSSTIEDISTYGRKRDMQYEAVGHKIADLSDTLIALWDGKDIGLMGGTGEIVNYYLKKENHKMYHLYVSRDKDVTNTMIDFKLYKNST